VNDIEKPADCSDTETRLRAEAEALKRLNEASSRLWRTNSLRDGLEEMLAATIELLGADMGNVQILDAASGNLTIAAQKGFEPEFLDFFREVSVEDRSACGQALRARERIVIEDVERDLLFAACLPIARNAGFRAVQSTPLVDRNGKPLGMISTHFRGPHRPSELDLQRLDLYARQASDFIERCKLESDLRSVSAALREKEEKLTFALEASGIGAWDVDLSNGLAFRSKEHARIFGYDDVDAEWGIERFLGQILEADREEAKKTLSRTIEGKESFTSEFRIRRVDGAVRWLWVSGKYREASDGEPPHFAGVVRDITDLKRAEDAVRQMDARSTFIADRAEVGYWEWDLNAGIVECSPQTRKLFDFGADEAVTYGRFLSSLHPDDRERTEKAVAECLDGAANYDIQFRVMTRLDGVRWIHSRGNVTFSDGHPAMMAGIALDVSKQKQAEEGLLERGQHMQLATEATGVGIWEWNVVTDKIRWDPQMFRIYGIEETAGGIVDYATWSGAVLPEELSEQERLLREHALEGGISHRRFRIRRRVDGEVRDIEACEIGRCDTAGRRQWVVGTNLDVTARRRAEAALRDADRRKDEFLATLAHELRNPLAAICECRT
jgi:PAS domain S-box-containing protein